MTLPFMVATLMLTEEITEKINIQLNKIINSLDLSLIEIGISSDKIDVSEFKYSLIVENQKMWEDIAKLSINLIVDYEYYRQFSFEGLYSIKEYNVRLLNLGFVFENNYWKSVRKPDIKDVQTNIFMYFLYRLILDKMSFNLNNQQNNENEKIHTKLKDDERDINAIIVGEFDGSDSTLVLQDSANAKINFDPSSFCKTDILITDSKCNESNSSADDLKKHFNEKEMKFHENILDNCGISYECSVTVCGAYMVGGGTELDDCGIKSVEEASVKDCIKENTNIKKWTCGGCGLLNEYSVVTCVVCYGLYKNGKWTCSQCKASNKGSSDQCRSCKKKNINNITIVDHNKVASYKNLSDVDNFGVKSDKETHIPGDEWRCGVCKTRQSYKYIVCEVCGHSRGVSGEWMCVKCTTINKCYIDKCQCDEWNDKLPIRLCQYCKTNRVSKSGIRCEDCVRDINKQWKCGYSKCGIMNSDLNEYCCKCNFWWHNTYGRGDECKQQVSLGGINNGWLCFKCGTFNDLSNIKCTKSKCEESRYAKILCGNCKKYNDHILLKCQKCGTIL